jgi:hypothetical protein
MAATATIPALIDFEDLESALARDAWRFLASKRTAARRPPAAEAAARFCPSCGLTLDAQSGAAHLGVCSGTT